MLAFGFQPNSDSRYVVAAIGLYVPAFLEIVTLLDNHGFVAPITTITDLWNIHALNY